MAECEAPHLRVLVVDDSAVVRQLVPALLAEAGIEVQAASDPLIAMHKMQLFRPDVILLDIEMPRMDGLTFLRRQMAEDPIPIVICSGHAGTGTAKALQALEDGAIEVLTKPRFGVRAFLEESSEMLIDTVRAAAQVRFGAAARGPRAVEGAPVRGREVPWTPRPQLHCDQVVVIGASTGGPEALRLVVNALPAGFPGVVIAQHMPKAFTGPFAQRLDQSSALAVAEATDGAPVTRGQVLVAPGGVHTLLVRDGFELSVQVTPGPLVQRHRPSIDVLFGSAAEAVASNAIGVLLTGMGRDGVAGLEQLRAVGADTLAQHEDGCVIFGMPKEAIARGAARAVVRLQSLAPALIERAARFDSRQSTAEKPATAQHEWRAKRARR